MADSAHPKSSQAGIGAVADVPQPDKASTLDAAKPVSSSAPPPASGNTNELSESDMEALLSGAAAADLNNAGVSSADGEGLDASGFPAAGPLLDAKQFELPDLAESQSNGIEPHRVSMLHDVNLRVRVELGRTRMRVEEVLKLGEGSIVELEKLAGDPVDVYVNDRLLARGEVLVLNDSFCVRVSEVFTPDPHRIAT